MVVAHVEGMVWQTGLLDGQRKQPRPLEQTRYRVGIVLRLVKGVATVVNGC